MPLTVERLRQAYRRMKTIREFEERLHTEIATGEIPGFTHLYAGQEAVAVGVCEPLTDADYIASTHRSFRIAAAKCTGCARSHLARSAELRRGRPPARRLD